MFFSLSKILWWFASPGNFLLLLICFGGLLTFSRWHRAGRRLCVAVALLMFGIATVPIGNWMTTALENRFPVVRDLPPDIDGIVALGGVANLVVTDARGRPAISEAVERLTAMARIGRRHPNARLIFSGGPGLLFNQALKEGDMLAPFFADIGLNPRRVEIENKSRNTYENATTTYKLASPKQDETWVLITSAFHMPRAVGSFREAGWENILAYPVDFRSTGSYGHPLSIPKFTARISALEKGVHEWLGLFFYWITGRSDEFFPAP